MEQLCPMPPATVNPGRSHPDGAGCVTPTTRAAVSPPSKIQAGACRSRRAGIGRSCAFLLAMGLRLSIGGSEIVAPSRRLRSDLSKPLQDFYSLPQSTRRDSSSGTLLESRNESLQRCFRLLCRAPPKFSDPMLHVSICEQPRGGRSCRSISESGVRQCVPLRGRHSARNGLRKHLVPWRGDGTYHWLTP